MRSAERDVRRPGSKATPVSHSPGRPTLVLAPVAQQKSLKMLTRSRHHLAHDAAQPDQVAHGFMIGVGHPHGRQLTGPIETGEHGGVAAVRLHPIARLPRNQRWRHHVAPMAETCELAMNAITARAGLIAKRQRLARPPETVAQLGDGIRVIGNLPKIFHRAGTSALRHRNRNPLLVNIQTNKSGMFHEARLLCMRLCAGQPA
jgi:hypothetical protein